MHSSRDKNDFIEMICKDAKNTSDMHKALKSKDVENIGLDNYSKVDIVGIVEIDCPFGDCPVTVFQAKGRLRISCINISYKKDMSCTKIDGICRLNLCFEEFGYIPILPP